MEKLPSYITVIFLTTVALTFFLFVNSTKAKLKVALISLAWLGLSGVLAARGFFQNTSAVPPRLVFAILPAIIVMVVLLVTKKGKRFIDGLDLKNLTLLHIVRVPVELTLYWLAVQKTIPELMTFAGRNFDVFSGLTAPLIYLVCFKNSRLTNRRLLLAWNLICLALLFNIVINAILSAPFPFQQFAFDQPDVAILYFPFTWLPAFIVVIVLFSHIAAIRKLIKPGPEIKKHSFA